MPPSPSTRSTRYASRAASAFGPSRPMIPAATSATLRSIGDAELLASASSRACTSAASARSSFSSEVRCCEGGRSASEWNRSWTRCQRGLSTEPSLPRLQRLLQPRLGHPPVPVHDRLGNPERVRRLGDRQAAEEAIDDAPRLAFGELHQLLERGVQLEELLGSLAELARQLLVEGHVGRVAPAALLRELPPRRIDEDLAHRACGNLAESDLRQPRHVRRLLEPDPRLVHERGRAEIDRPGPAADRGCQASQPVVGSVVNAIEFLALVGVSVGHNAPPRAQRKTLARESRGNKASAAAGCGLGGKTISMTSDGTASVLVE